MGVLAFVYVPLFLAKHFNPWGMFDQTDFWPFPLWCFGFWKIIIIILALIIFALLIAGLVMLFVWLTDGETP